MKFGWKQFWKETPRAVRIFGYALMAGSTFAATTWQFYFAGNPKYTMALVIAGVVGKTLTSFVSEKDTSNTDNNPAGV